MRDEYLNDPGAVSDYQDILQSKEEREYVNRKEILDKAVDGWKRYNFDPTFRSVVEAMMRGVDSWDIIEKLLENNLQMRQKIESILRQWPGPFGPNL